MKTTVVVRCARTYGLLQPLRSLMDSTARLDEKLEVVVVDCLYEERKELLAAWWYDQAAGMKLIHVPPLDPLEVRGRRYHAWDICLSLNTGLAHATGDVILHLEDHWVVREDWVETMTQLVANNPDYVVFGDKFAEPLLNMDAPGHYNIPRNPAGKFLPLKVDQYGGAIMVNFGHLLKPFVNVSFPEWPSRWPETFWSQQLALTGLGYATTDTAPAWHANHPPGGGIAGYVSRMEGGLLTYREKEGAGEGAHSAYAEALKRPDDADLHRYRRDLIVERRRIHGCA